MFAYNFLYKYCNIIVLDCMRRGYRLKRRKKESVLLFAALFITGMLIYAGLANWERTPHLYEYDKKSLAKEIKAADANRQASKEEDAEASFYEELLHKYHLVLNYRKAIGHLYTSKNRELISNYFYTVTEAFVMKHVQKEAEGMDVPEEDIRFIVDFYSNSLIGMMLRWIKEGMPEKKDHLIQKWSVSYQATVKILLQGCLAEQHPGASVFKRQAHDPLP